ncbi:MAG: DUF177 domain-containing protein [Gammaproteobacteria bacterium]|nr:DUF177 domain-containing protein [Gammaproteobacteria bacterium]
MPRLNEAVLSVGDVEVDLEFGIDAGRTRFISGTVRTRVSMPCQRCLESMEIDVDAEVRLGVVISESQIERLPSGFEPLLLEEELIDPAQLVEDELLLALPLVPRHELRDCRAERNVTAQGSDGAPAPSDDVAENKRPNPFAVLATLKDKH